MGEQPGVGPAATKRRSTQLDFHMEDSIFQALDLSAETVRQTEGLSLRHDF